MSQCAAHFTLITETGHWQSLNTHPNHWAKQFSYTSVHSHSDVSWNDLFNKAWQFPWEKMTFPQHLPDKNKYEHQLYETIVTEAD